MLPHWAAWITANARIALDQDTEAVGRSRVRYRDTDSIAVEGDWSGVKNRLKPDYGALKDEGEKRRIRYHAPKAYTYMGEDGLWKAVFKGLPRQVIDPNDDDKKPEAQRIIESIHYGRLTKPLTYKSTTSVQTFIKTGKMEIERTRSPTRPENVYGHVIENRWFRPRRVQAANAERGRPAGRAHARGADPRSGGQRSQVPAHHADGCGAGMEREPCW
jgi:hypothetical protein